jgi:hypothetical protein
MLDIDDCAKLAPAKAAVMPTTSARVVNVFIITISISRV